jgi:hypothetical protein
MIISPQQLDPDRAFRLVASRSSACARRSASHIVIATLCRSNVRRKEIEGGQMPKQLLTASALFAVLCTGASAEPQATNPDAIRGAWCYVKSTDATGKTVDEGTVEDEIQVFRRGSCTGGLGYVFTPRSIIGKFKGKQIGEHPLLSAESNERSGWIINVKYNYEYEQTGKREIFVYPMTNNRLGIIGPLP